MPFPHFEGKAHLPAVVPPPTKNSAAAVFVVADRLTDSGWSGIIEKDRVRSQLATIMRVAITTLHQRAAKTGT